MSEENKMEHEQVHANESEPLENGTLNQTVGEEIAPAEATEDVVGKEDAPAEATEDVVGKEDAPAEATEETTLRYCWSYREQHAFDTKKKDRARKRGVLLYAMVMATAFLLCFGILLGTVIWYGDGNDIWYESQQLTTIEIFEAVVPTTVFIQSYRAETLLGEGTGFFVRSDGYIATNYHVIEKSTQVKVYLNSGSAYVASVVGYDQLNDLAVLKIDGNGFPVPVFGNSDQLRIGETAIAIGHPGGAGGAWTVTEGIISALNRKVYTTQGSSFSRAMTVIQFDAAVNPGNSGGPLCNGNGEIVGVVTLKGKDLEGVGYAIPINHALNVINSIIGG